MFELSRALIIANPVAGRGEAEKYAELLNQHLSTYRNFEIELRLTKDADDALKWASHAYDDNFQHVFCLGGDGTVNEVISGLMTIEKENRPNFGFIPMGTANDLARALGYNLSPSKAVTQFNQAKLSEMDVGKVNDSYFCNVLAIGSIPQEVMNTESSDKNKLGYFAYIKNGIAAFFSNEGYHLQITSDQQVDDIKTNLVLVGLTNSVGGMEFVFPNATYNDGLVHLMAVKGETPIDLIFAAFQHGLSGLPQQNLLSLSSSHFEIKQLNQSQTPITSNVDGDEGPALPLNIQVIHSALKVWVPMDESY